MKIYYNKSVENFLQEASKTINNPICYFILNKVANTTFSFLDVSEDDSVSITPEAKIDKLYNESGKKLSYEDFIDSLQVDKTGPGYTKNRVTIKMGRLLKRVIESNKDYWAKFIERWRKINNDKRTEDEYVEELVLQYKAATKKIFDKAFDTRIEAVTGKDIAKWYSDKNYKPGKGSLHASCMRYDNCQSYFELYEKNPEVCSLLIYRETSDKISIRALLWKLEDGSFYMDRIYASDDSDKTIFMNYAKRNNWLSYDLHKGSLPQNIKFQLNKLNYGRFPYMDTFQFFDREKHILSIQRANDYSDQVKLIDPHGGYKSA